MRPKRTDEIHADIVRTRMRVTLERGPSTYLARFRVAFPLALLCGLLLSWLFAPSLAHAETALARVKRTGTLRWGGDLQGGEPFVYEDAHGVRKGFEVDIATSIAKRLGVREVFVQNDWSALPASLDRGTFDVVLNGFELTSSRATRVLYTRPYKAFSARLSVRESSPFPATRAALAGKKIGSLAGTRAFEILNEAGANAVSYEGTLEPYLDLERGRLDGVLLDDSIADRYGTRKKGVVVSGDLEQGAYAMATRKDEPELRAALDGALEDMIRTGELREILVRARLFDARDEALFAWTRDDLRRATGELVDSATPNGTSLAAHPNDAGVDSGPVTEAPSSELPNGPPEAPVDAKRFDFPRFLLFVRAAGVTLGLSLAGMAFASPLGLSLAVTRVYGGPFARRAAITYVELFRGTPLLLQLYLLYFGLAPWLDLPAPVAAVLALGLNYAAYEAEAYRAGIEAVPLGQVEAGLALGLSRRRVVWSVVLPQGARFALPNVTSDFVSLLKDSSLVSVITVVELTKQMAITAVDVRDWKMPGLACALLYLVLSVPLARLARRFEMARDDAERDTNAKGGERP